HVQPLVQELARLNLTDLVLEEPDLEEAVLTLYTGGADAEPAAGTVAAGSAGSAGNAAGSPRRAEGAHRA
ncbi:MAG: ABC transporter ATP-binding protein, partial [Paenarthrobacter sp.]